MKYKIASTKSFDKDTERMRRRGYDLTVLEDIVQQLAQDKPLSARHRDHQLKGRWQNYRECHITPDWLLIYLKENEQIILVLQRTGIHSDLFKL